MAMAIVELELQHRNISHVLSIQNSCAFVTKLINVCNTEKIAGHGGPDLMDRASPVANPARQSLVGAREGGHDSIPTSSRSFRAPNNRGPPILKFLWPWPLLSSSFGFPWSKQGHIGARGRSSRRRRPAAGLQKPRGRGAVRGERCVNG